MKMKRSINLQLKLTIFWFSRRAEGNFQKEKKHPAQEKTADKKQRARGVMGKKIRVLSTNHVLCLTFTKMIMQAIDH